MKISTKGRYALRVMIDLATNSNGRFISLKDIAQRQEISNKYLEQIISLLNKAGYLETARGNTGGYKLAKKPNEYKIGDKIDVAGVLEINTFGGVESIQINIKDIMKSI